MRKGSKMSDEQKKKISAAHMGKTRSDVTKEKIRQKLTGHKHSDETKLKMKRSQTGVKISDETKRKIGKANSGKKKPPFSDSHRAKISANLMGRVCSMTTRIKIGESQKGCKNHNWQGGVTDQLKLARDSIDYKEWRKKVYKRDNWHCHDCGVHCGSKNNKKIKTISAHHIKEFVGDGKTFSDYDEKNGITLCASCHSKLHNKQRKIKLCQY